MLIRKIALENVRSFLDRQELSFDGLISIIIGPNGGGKTNLLDTVVTMLRRYLFATPYFELVSIGQNQMGYQVQPNGNLESLTLEKHATALDRPQTVEITIEISETDLANMQKIRDDAEEIEATQRKTYAILNSPWTATQQWDISALNAKDQITYVWTDGQFMPPESKAGADFLQYLQLFELDNSIRNEHKKASLQLPMIYLPVHRAAAQFQSKVALSGYRDKDQKRGLDSTSSRNGGTNVVNLAVGRLGQRYRLLELDDNTSVKVAFYNDPQLKALTATLKELGYSWKLETTNPNTNEYDVMLTKQGTEFAANAASSGERELLTYLFAIYALNVRDAVIVVDEPELHLHPRWQKTLFELFERLSRETGNQFILATHSPTFISPASIQYVSRIYIEGQKSRIVRLNATDLPNAKHLFNIVNSQNNERLFFCDRVVLVEGLSDRIFFEKVFDRFGRSSDREVIEIISVGGKYLFPQYQKLLQACHVESTIISDRDYIEQVGSEDVKKLFKVNAKEIKKHVVDNVASLDGDALFARIEEAMTSGNWTDAQETWEYIKSRRIEIKPELTDAERQTLANFLAAQKAAGVYILSEGALESYLPEGHRNKNLEKLITFLENVDYWENLPLPARNEIEEISTGILGIVERAAE